MPFRDHKGFIFSETAASAIVPGAPVRFSASPAVELVPVNANASIGAGGEILGVAEASAVRGDKITVYGNDNIVKVKAAASLGAGAQVAPGIATTGFAPVVAASAPVYCRSGIALEAAAAGDSFALFVNPKPVFP